MRARSLNCRSRHPSRDWRRDSWILWLDKRAWKGTLSRTFNELIIMEIKRVGSQPSAKGPADWFTGTVRIDSAFKGTEPARVAGAIVTFEPGAPDGLAHAPVGADPGHHRGLWLGTALGRSHRGNSPGRHRLVPARREALARGDSHHRHDPHRRSRAARCKAVDWMEKVVMRNMPGDGLITPTRRWGSFRTRYRWC
jgi:hypothetical protein